VLHIGLETRGQKTHFSLLEKYTAGKFFLLKIDVFSILLFGEMEKII
jgi:hypothetical protein